MKNLYKNNRVPRSAGVGQQSTPQAWTLSAKDRSRFGILTYTGAGWEVDSMSWIWSDMLISVVGNLRLDSELEKQLTCKSFHKIW